MGKANKRTIGLEEQYDKIYRYCYFRVHGREIAEDITQETFLRFFENKRYAGFGHEMQVLYTIARNLCIDEYRKQKPLPLHDDMLQNQEMAVSEGDVILRLSVRAALDELEDSDRELLLLRYVNGVPIADIGKILGKSRFAIHRSLNRVKKELACKLREEDFH